MNSHPTQQLYQKYVKHIRFAEANLSQIHEQKVLRKAIKFALFKCIVFFIIFYLIIFSAFTTMAQNLKLFSVVLNINSDKFTRQYNLSDNDFWKSLQVSFYFIVFLLSTYVVNKVEYISYFIVFELPNINFEKLQFIINFIDTLKHAGLSCVLI